MRARVCATPCRMSMIEFNNKVANYECFTCNNFLKIKSTGTFLLINSNIVIKHIHNCLFIHQGAPQISVGNCSYSLDIDSNNYHTHLSVENLRFFSSSSMVLCHASLTLLFLIQWFIFKHYVYTFTITFILPKWQTKFW